MDTTEAREERLASKTPQERFKRIMEEEYHYAPKIAAAILAEAEDCLYRKAAELRPGQMRVIMAKRGERSGNPRNSQVEVIWTVDAGVEDREVMRMHGREALRQVRIERLLDEALEQGGAATQEDLAAALHTSVRTIKRDFGVLQRRGEFLPSRGMVEGIGRGQTHKGRIIRLWLQGETFDRLATHTRHSPSSIQRYLRHFVQVVGLHQQGFKAEEIGLALQMGVHLVEEYVEIYAQHDLPAQRARLQEQMERLQRVSTAQKGAK